MLTPEEADALAAPFRKRPARTGRYSMTREEYLRLDPTRPITDTLEERNARGALLHPITPPAPADIVRMQEREHRRRRKEAGA